MVRHWVTFRYDVQEAEEPGERRDVELLVIPAKNRQTHAQGELGHFVNETGDELTVVVT